MRSVSAALALFLVACVASPPQPHRADLEEQRRDDETREYRSPDGTRAARVEEDSVVVDGVSYGPYENVAISDAAFSLDSARFAFAGLRDDRWRVVVDGEERGDYARLPQGGAPAHLADGRLIHAADSGDGKWSVYLDGERVHSFEDIQLPGLVLSPDRSGHAYVALDDGMYTAFVDGEPQKPYRRVGSFTVDYRGRVARNLLLSAGVTAAAVFLGAPAGSFVAFLGGKGRVTDVRSIVYSPDSRHYVYRAIDRAVQVLVVDGIELRILPVFPSVEAVGFTEGSQEFWYKLKGQDRLEVVNLADELALPRFELGGAVDE